ncbi:hypothetical protein [Paraburkholderia silvatlantica]|uniref:Uncharacterized protein n=1 Tax=Paraburkholderia silvatlantica TaxID=321895 RepID=A0ABR6FX38_9BURK|nr:hypothetical protein [Paraburkholderia silvatlantica]MBB2931996.1 hypothetical protein [Paraburkholderia silvatlantica]PVY24671.1 hypothetical protein C7411_12760 [Paraburkholderia silvatlantica]PXW31167.1 hypothetical protein C7413_12660 [Paraburkholderia silvatlantica]
MLNIFNPTIDAPTDVSPAWYVTFHDAYCLSQLTNAVLVGALDSLAHVSQADVSDDDVHAHQRPSAGIDSVVSSIIDRLHQLPEELKALVMGMMLDPGDSFARNINIDGPKLLQTTGAENWQAAISGFLNIWEFLFLYSQVESTLKQVLNAPDEGVDGLVNAAFKRDANLADRLSKRDYVDRNYCAQLWKLFTAVRRLCAHAHGFLARRDIEDLKKFIVPFRKSVDTYFERVSERNLLTAQFVRFDPMDLFREEKLVDGRFYLLDDLELNVFRHFVCCFMPELQSLPQSIQ